MWGTSAHLNADGTATQQSITRQLGRINYKRPDTWSFLIGARLTGGAVNASPGNLLVIILVDLIVGLGRSNLDTHQNPAQAIQQRFAFARFQFNVPVGTAPGQQLNNVKYTTEVLAPPLEDDFPAVRQTIDTIPAQDIQVVASLDKIAAAGGQDVNARVDAYFAPRTHLRPDWFTVSAGQFLGDETGGT